MINTKITIPRNTEIKERRTKELRNGDIIKFDNQNYHILSFKRLKKWMEYI